MEVSFLLPREKYTEVSKARGKLPNFEIEKNGQVLFYFGANHSRDPNNEQYPKLRKYWKKFLNETKKKKCIVLIEGRLRDLAKTEDEAIKGSEGGFITFLAHKEGIGVACPEPSERFIDEILLKNFSRDEIFYYDFATMVNNWQKFPEPRQDFEKYASNWMPYEKERKSWNDEFDFSLEHAKAIHKNLFNKEFNPNDPIVEIVNPNLTDTVINRLARMSSDIRDFQIASEIERYWNEGKNIFVVFGSGHLIIEEPALKKVLSGNNSGKIFLVRHGQDTDNAAGILNGRRDTDLTNLGREQAKQVAQKLRDNNIEIIYTSPLKRAYETARIIATELEIDEVIVDEHLIERNFGILTGKPVADISKYTNKILLTDKVNYFLEIEEAEDFPTLLARGKKILEEIKQRHPGQNILIVTHGDIGKMIRAAFHNWTWEQGLKTPYFENTGVLELSERQDILE